MTSNVTTKNQNWGQLSFDFVYHRQFSWFRIVVIFSAISLIFFLSLPLSAETIIERSPLIAFQKTANINFQEIATSTDKLTYNIIVDSGNQSINVVGVYINFATSSLKLESIDLTDSFCDLIIENSIDNQLGQARIFCGKPFPGASGTLEVGQLVFSQKNQDVPIISFGDETLVLANDGLGTDILKR